MERSRATLPKSLFDYGRVFKRYRAMILFLVAGATLLTGIHGKFLATKIYEAKATVMPAREEVMGGGFSFGGGGNGGGGNKGGSGGGGGGGMSMLLEGLGASKGGPTILETMRALFVSRRMAETVITKLDLKSYYGVESMSQAVDILRGEASFYRTIDKTFEITVLSKDPLMAAKIANAYAVEVDNLNRDISLASTRRHRAFVEERLAEKTKALEAAESALKEFQTQHRTFQVTEQAEAAMEAVADLHGQIVEREVGLAALRAYATPNHPQLSQYQAEISELRRQLDRLEQDQVAGRMPKRQGDRSLAKRPLLAFEETPALAIEYLHLMRQVKVEEALYGMLLGTLEQAKMNEVKDLPTIEVLDAAIPPEVKARPRTLQNVAAAFAFSLVLGILLAFLLNYLEWLKVQEQEAATHELGGGVVTGASNGQVNGHSEHEQDAAAKARRASERLPV